MYIQSFVFSNIEIKLLSAELELLYLNIKYE